MILCDHFQFKIFDVLFDGIVTCDINIKIVNIDRKWKGVYTDQPQDFGDNKW